MGLLSVGRQATIITCYLMHVIIVTCICLPAHACLKLCLILALSCYPSTFEWKCSCSCSTSVFLHKSYTFSAVEVCIHVHITIIIIVIIIETHTKEGAKKKMKSRQQLGNNTNIIFKNRKISKIKSHKMNAISDINISFRIFSNMLSSTI